MKITRVALTLFFFLFFANQVFAIDTATTPGNLDSSTESAKAVPEYNLAYPGILPDNPLYFLKAIRDRIIGFLMNDPIKKTEFNLLTSDKRIYAAWYLVEKGKDELAVTTLSKSNNYFHNAIGTIKNAKKMGKHIDTVLNNMWLSVKKHKQLLLDIEKKADSQYKNQLQTERARLIDFEKIVNELNSSK